MSTATFHRYVNDAATAEQELNARAGQRVELIGEPFSADPDEYIIMQRIRFSDGFETEAFADELTEKEVTP